MNRRHRRQPISNINVVPYLDVLLVLLVIFMITAPLFNQGVVELPKAGEKALPTAKKAALEIIYQEATTHPYTLIDHTENEETPKLSEEQLMEELGTRSVLYDKPEDTHVIISAEGTLPYKDVIRLFGLLYDEGYKNIALAAQSDKK